MDHARDAEKSGVIVQAPHKANPIRITMSDFLDYFYDYCSLVINTGNNTSSYGVIAFVASAVAKIVFT